MYIILLCVNRLIFMYHYWKCHISYKKNSIDEPRKPSIFKDPSMEILNKSHFLHIFGLCKLSDVENKGNSAVFNVRTLNLFKKIWWTNQLVLGTKLVVLFLIIPFFCSFSCIYFELHSRLCLNC